MIAIRKSNQALLTGSYQIVDVYDNWSCFAMIRKSESGYVVVVYNLSGESEDISLNFTGTELENIAMSAGNDLYDIDLLHTDLTTDNYTNYSLSVPAYGVRLIPFN